jgi:hypothetical protein
MAKKSPDPIDKHVGGRVRMRRMMLAMSQEKLGDALDLTFQQVQKGAVVLCVGIRCGAISSGINLSSQAARSIG